MQLLFDPFAWFIAASVLIVIEIIDGTFTTFAPTGVGALATAVAIHFGVTVHPLIIFSVSVIISFMIFQRINRSNGKDDDVNKY